MKGSLQIAVITGLSGSGKSTAIRALEDLGYYCIDNLPAVLIPRFLELCESSDEITRVALGVDTRGRGFLDELPRVLDEVRRRGHRVLVVYLDAADEALVRRFSETRRPHPMAEGSDIAAGIRRERELLAGLRGDADRVLDTTAFTSHQLREELRSLFGRETGSTAMRVALVSFGFKFGLPADADIVFDVRFLPNPFYVDELRPQSGLDETVAAYVLADPATGKFLDLADEFFQFALPSYLREGKSYLTVALGCTGGRHRSVVLVERLREMLDGRGAEVTVRHRDVGR
ncbi:MAG TPA: RNase adapter RapZ [Candidatus Binatia bacterium]|nr:RNase adapter RapZ [Candidatus Binatia bacterium]